MPTGLVESTFSTEARDSTISNGKDSKLTPAGIYPSVLKVKVSSFPFSPKSNSTSLF